MPINPTFFDIGREVLGPSIGDQTPERGRLAALARDRSLFYFAPSLGALVTCPISDYTWADGDDIPLAARLSDDYRHAFQTFPDRRKVSELFFLFEDLLRLPFDDSTVPHCLTTFTNLLVTRFVMKGALSNV